ncbi:MAG: nickel-dependent hydrogenase large subunit, partial [Alphaproteobacteria bacterium]|nr:nickel-dependent hydrogenase large subunit [Alphaproteobacteria bacterium]
QAAFLPARARFLHLMGLLAGKWPHTLALQPGGTTKSIDAGEKVRLLSILHEFRSHLEGDLLGGPLEEIAALENAQALFALGERRPGADLSLFLTAARDLGLERAGRAHDRFMSAGAFGLFKDGLWDDGRPAPLDLGTITEDPAHAWLSGASAHPARGRTLPDALKPDAYTWCKAPRLSGRPVEVGALARQVIDGHPLLRDLVATNGGGVLARIAARMVETARLLPAMESWVRALAPREPYCLPCPPLETGAGLGLVEAARGTLGHWLTVADNRIANYQIVAPTTWNFSPRDAAGQPGPLETALIGLPASDDGRASAMVHHVVRSFDPCMACTVH